VSYTFVKHYTKKYEVTFVLLKFMKYSSICKVRKDKLYCELCGTKLQGDDNTNLAMLNGHVNKLICDKCAQEAIEGGAEGKTREEKAIE
jgi:hypothetical protein